MCSVFSDVANYYTTISCYGNSYRKGGRLFRLKRTFRSLRIITFNFSELITNWYKLIADAVIALDQLDMITICVNYHSNWFSIFPWVTSMNNISHH